MAAIKTELDMDDQPPSLRHYVLQSGYAVIFLWLVLFSLDQVSAPGLLWAVGASSVASSSFIVFTRPCGQTTEPVRLIGSYLLSILIGIGCSHIVFFLHHVVGFPHLRAMELSSALSVGLATFLMAVLHFQHPPAASMSLVLTLEPWGFATVIVIVSAIFVLAGLSIILRPYLRNLFKI